MGRATSLSPKGQVTVPKAIRDRFGLKPFDKIEFYVENDEVKLRKARFRLDEMEGMLPALEIPIEEMPAVAWNEWTERGAKEDR